MRSILLFFLVLLLSPNFAMAKVKIKLEPREIKAQKLIPELEKRLHKVFGATGVIVLEWDREAFAKCRPEGLRVALARLLVEKIHPTFHGAIKGGSELEQRIYHKGWATYGAELMFSGGAAWRYLSPCANDDSKMRRWQSREKQMKRMIASAFEDGDDAYLGYRIAKSLEPTIDRKVIQLMTFSEFQTQLQSWIAANQ